MSRAVGLSPESPVALATRAKLAVCGGGVRFRRVFRFSGFWRLMGGGEQFYTVMDRPSGYPKTSSPDEFLWLYL